MKSIADAIREYLVLQRETYQHVVEKTDLVDDEFKFNGIIKFDGDLDIAEFAAYIENAIK